MKLTASFKSPADMIDPNVGLSPTGIYFGRTWLPFFRGVDIPTFLYTVLFVSLVSFFADDVLYAGRLRAGAFSHFIGRNLVFGLSDLLR